MCEAAVGEEKSTIKLDYIGSDLDALGDWVVGDALFSKSVHRMRTILAHYGG